MCILIFVLILRENKPRGVFTFWFRKKASKRLNFSFIQWVLFSLCFVRQSSFIRRLQQIQDKNLRAPGRRRLHFQWPNGGRYAQPHRMPERRHRIMQRTQIICDCRCCGFLSKSSLWKSSTFLSKRPVKKISTAVKQK